MKFLEECKDLANAALIGQEQKNDDSDFAATRNSRAFKRRLGQLALEVEGKTQQLQAANLSDDKGVREALKLQGEVAGLKRCLDLMLEGIEN
jgi:hypothetical protein